ncbi:hypothetical protein GXB85_08160 [Cellulomonas sp. APG4]|uniref:hypothetical protein n=1 Tax=Cellulomonas sp. APG4 TaxID=1538656 RepID=UPI00137AE9DF|nr:hypothetical protein [Cellulomonas sp. APG4]NCT90917.1 hypothetical protein [Cellulomonas sp. APG4]
MTLLQEAPRTAPVAAVITDALVAVEVARHAASWAGAGGPLLLLVPTPRLGPTLRRATLERGRRRRDQETSAVVARVTPTLAGHDGEIRWRAVPYRPTGAHPAAALATAVLRSASQAGARALVAPDPVAARLPARAGLVVVGVRSRDRWARRGQPDRAAQWPARGAPGAGWAGLEAWALDVRDGHVPD